MKRLLLSFCIIMQGLSAYSAELTILSDRGTVTKDTKTNLSITWNSNQNSTLRYYKNDYRYNVDMHAVEFRLSVSVDGSPYTYVDSEYRPPNSTGVYSVDFDWSPPETGEWDTEVQVNAHYGYSYQDYNYNNYWYSSYYFGYNYGYTQYYSSQLNIVGYKDIKVVDDVIRLFSSDELCNSSYDSSLENMSAKFLFNNGYYDLPSSNIGARLLSTPKVEANGELNGLFSTSLYKNTNSHEFYPKHLLKIYNAVTGISEKGVTEDQLVVFSRRIPDDTDFEFTTTVIRDRAGTNLNMRDIFAGIMLRDEPLGSPWDDENPADSIFASLLLHNTLESVISPGDHRRVSAIMRQEEAGQALVEKSHNIASLTQNKFTNKVSLKIARFVNSNSLRMSYTMNYNPDGSPDFSKEKVVHSVISPISKTGSSEIMLFTFREQHSGSPNENLVTFNNTKLSFCATEPPPPCTCTSQYLPVCGEDDGKTYGNLCVAKCEKPDQDYSKGRCNGSDNSYF